MISRKIDGVGIKTIYTTMPSKLPQPFYDESCLFPQKRLELLTEQAREHGYHQFMEMGAVAYHRAVLFA
ncbi:hypothetical protein YC2023_020757 [Brassica napus]